MTEPSPSHSASPKLPAPDASVLAEAERWLGRHDRGLSSEEVREFAAWQAASPVHLAEFQRVQSGWDGADLLRNDPRARARAAEIDATTRRQQREREARRRRMVSTGFFATAAAGLALALVWVAPWRSPSDKSTAAAPAAMALPEIELLAVAARSLALPDGSNVAVRGESVVQPVFSAGERRVRLTEGEALFSVAKDPARPFVVEVGGVAVRAVGTAFNVRFESGAIEVLVTEGTVSLHAGSGSKPAASDPRIKAGHRTTLDATSAVAPQMAALAVEPLSPAQIEQALAWQTPRLVLRRATLADAIAAFNRHGPTPVELADATLAAQRVSGTFRADNAGAFVRVLELADQVRVERTADGRVRLHAPR
jgi:transmembrane sensor